ncbi:nucleotidyltransferase domain-containing protein [Paenibacillus doosanensis]|uniref:nucleotidyltransferase domain-containing protein n=1 Tax=Paenibacillus doosanensis TaxID=1229154 RepID=UPI00217F720B|nr:nucleotidyltransferase domain-containing protein [Paenibacillus doosanensis]MCS7464418.1 nucleotidyltransferase domain-containing protein [Paenibacillus doosanensis]
MHWKAQLVQTANRIAGSFRGHPNVAAVAIGGSIGRGQMWKHSDLELCLVVEQRMDQYQHFNYIDDMGVEIIQITRSRMAEFIRGFRQPDKSLLAFPIQIYRCRIVYDPENMLEEFKQIYDTYLFHDDVAALKQEEALQQADLRLGDARELAEAGEVGGAAGHLRIGLNFLLLASYWHYRILPRSQNRTIYFLKKNSEAPGRTQLRPLYDLFVEAFGLNRPHKELKERLLQAQSAIFAIAEASWGSNTPVFLEHAVDGNLEWGHDRSIVYVYKYCVHRMQLSGGRRNPYDTAEFAESYPQLHRFLDFGDITADEVHRWIKQYAEIRSRLAEPERAGVSGRS